MMTISLSPAAEAAVSSRAAAVGVPPEQFVSEFVERQFKPVQEETRPPSREEIAQWFAEFRAIANSEGKLPSLEDLRDPNFTRETIYQDHE